MKIRTVSDLDNYLYESITWRLSELRSIKSLVQSSKNQPSNLKCYLRSGVTMLYAHWEGFVKEASLAYLNFVGMQKLRYDELSVNFIALVLKAKLNRAEKTNKIIFHNDIVKFLLSDLSQRSTPSLLSNAISTEANLSSDVFRNIVYSLGLRYQPEYELREKLIDIRLLRLRNEIAHGEFISVDFAGFEELFDKVTELITLFQNQISNAAARGDYKRTSYN